MSKNTLPQIPEYEKGGKNYPYWGPDFRKEFKGLVILYCTTKQWDRWKDKNTSELPIEMADSYRVFMILCNINYHKTRMEVLEQLKAATVENPIVIEDEVFWTEKD